MGHALRCAHAADSLRRRRQSTCQRTVGTRAHLRAVGASAQRGGASWGLKIFFHFLCMASDVLTGGQPRRSGNCHGNMPRARFFLLRGLGHGEADRQAAASDRKVP